MQSKITAKHYENFSVYHLKPFSCTICKEDIPAELKHKGEKYNLIDMKSSSKSHLILEYLPDDETGSYFIYKLEFGKSERIVLVAF